METLDFTIVANNLVPVNVTVNQQDGTPLNMTGYSAFVQVFAPNIIDPVIAYSTTAGNVTIAGNVISFNIQPADTVNLQLQTYTDYIFEIVLLDVDGNPVTLTKGDPRLCWGTLTIRRQWAIPGASPGAPIFYTDDAKTQEYFVDDSNQKPLQSQD